jgi:membrane protease YdiL (CAAX protease family)
MSSPNRSPAATSPWNRYLRATRTPTYGFLSTLPLLVLYEAMIVGVNTGSVAPVRVGAEVWLKQLLAVVGAAGGIGLGIAVLVIGLGVFFADRRRSIPLRGAYFGGILGESAAYAIVVAMLSSEVVGLLFAAAPTPSGDMWSQLALSIGAGLYEELLFRVLLVGGLALVFRQLFRNAHGAYVGAALLGALLFSAVHYVGALGDPFAWTSFTFRFVFGLLLNGLFLWRGFGVAAWTHALYDVMLVVGILG